MRGSLLAAVLIPGLPNAVRDAPLAFMGAAWELTSRFQFTPVNRYVLGHPSHFLITSFLVFASCQRCTHKEEETKMHSTVVKADTKITCCLENMRDTLD